MRVICAKEMPAWGGGGGGLLEPSIRNSPAPSSSGARNPSSASSFGGRPLCPAGIGDSEAWGSGMACSPKRHVSVQRSNQLGLGAQEGDSDMLENPCKRRCLSRADIRIRKHILESLLFAVHALRTTREAGTASQEIPVTLAQPERLPA